MGTQYGKERIPGTVTEFGLRDVPALVLWNCPGAREIDLELLRWGVIVKKAFTCGTTRGTLWSETTHDLRHRSLEADRMRLALAGLI